MEDENELAQSDEVFLRDLLEKYTWLNEVDKEWVSPEERKELLKGLDTSNNVKPEDVFIWE